jgi:formate hydrogenlyase subunit 3/multisubunit Na+/H+ antiporter MnhD subunit
VEGLAVSILLLLNRWIAVSLIGMGMGILRRDRETDAFSAMAGAVRRKPFAVLGLTIGGLSLAGFPLTGGFTARWLALQGLPVSVQPWAPALMLAGMAVSVGYLRGLAQTAGDPPAPSSEEEPFSIRLIILLLIACAMFLALYPQVALGPIGQVMSTLVALH